MKKFILFNILIIFVALLSLEHNNKIYIKNHNSKNIKNKKQLYQQDSKRIIENNKNYNENDVLNNFIDYNKKLNLKNKKQANVYVENPSNLNYKYKITFNTFSKNNSNKDTNTIDADNLMTNNLLTSATGQKVDKNDVFNMKIQIYGAFQGNIKAQIMPRYFQLLYAQELSDENVSYTIKASGILTCPRILLYENYKNINTGKNLQVVIGQYQVYNYYKSDFSWSFQTLQYVFVSMVSVLFIACAGVAGICMLRRFVQKTKNIVSKEPRPEGIKTDFNEGALEEFPDNTSTNSANKTLKNDLKQMQSSELLTKHDNNALEKNGLQQHQQKKSDIIISSEETFYNDEEKSKSLRCNCRGACNHSVGVGGKLLVDSTDYYKDHFSISELAPNLIHDEFHDELNSDTIIEPVDDYFFQEIDINTEFNELEKEFIKLIDKIKSTLNLRKQSLAKIQTAYNENVEKLDYLKQKITSLRMFADNEKFNGEILVPIEVDSEHGSWVKDFRDLVLQYRQLTTQTVESDDLYLLKDDDSSDESKFQITDNIIEEIEKEASLVWFNTFDILKHNIHNLKTKINAFLANPQYEGDFYHTRVKMILEEINSYELDITKKCKEWLRDYDKKLDILYTYKKNNWSTNIFDSHDQNRFIGGRYYSNKGKRFLWIVELEQAILELTWNQEKYLMGDINKMYDNCLENFKMYKETKEKFERLKSIPGTSKEISILNKKMGEMKAFHEKALSRLYELDKNNKDFAENIKKLSEALTLERGIILETLYQGTAQIFDSDDKSIYFEELLSNITIINESKLNETSFMIIDNNLDAWRKKFQNFWF